MKRCHSVTNSGERCSRRVLPGRRYCWQHDSRIFQGITLAGVLGALLALIGLVSDLVSLGFPLPALGPVVPNQPMSTKGPAPITGELQPFPLEGATLQVESACNELQIVMLIDQSKSMGGFAEGDNVPATDPHGFRHFAPRAALDRLASYQATAGQGDGAVRLAMVYFGTSPDLVMPWIVIAPETRIEAQQLTDSLAHYFTPIDYHMGETLFMPAFQLADALFDQVDSAQDGCVRKVIILLTDGKPSTNDIEQFDWRGHMRELAEYAEDHLVPKGIQSHVIGIEEQEGSYWEDVWPYWSIVVGEGGSVHRARTPEEAASLMLSVTASRFLVND